MAFADLSFLLIQSVHVLYIHVSFLTYIIYFVQAAGSGLIEIGC